jgi:uncharacterized protein
VQIADRIKGDVATAMKAGQRDRVTALRLVLSELQKAEKDGDSDELAVLRREARAIEAYLPAEMSDEELDALVATALAETGAEGPRDMGKAIKHVMAAAGGRADGRRVSTKVKEALS